MHPGVYARTRHDHPAVVMASTGERVTYRELDERSNRLAQVWHARGLRPDDHVAILLPNGPAWFDAVWAALRSALYYTPVNWHLTAPEVAYIVQDCGARSVVTAAAFADKVTGLDIEIPLVTDGDKCPRSVDFDAALPRQDTGKPYKRLPKDRYWGDRASRIV